VENFYVEFGDLSCIGFLRYRAKKHKRREVKPLPFDCRRRE